MNGTTNYILDQMDTTGATFADALKDAQELGYAEADPTADVEGHDAASKAAIVASLAFHSDFTIDDVHVEGITAVSADDVAAADADGYVIKLLSVCERDGEGSISVWLLRLFRGSIHWRVFMARLTPCLCRRRTQAS